MDSLVYINDGVELEGKRVLLRASLNVPTISGKVTNDFRIKKALTTIKYLIENKAQVIIISHIKRDKKATLKPVFEELKKYIPDLVFAQNYSSLRKFAEKGRNVLYENLRQDEREYKKDLHFAEKFTKLADLFVQDAFSVLHREHTSIVTIPQLIPSYGGLLVKDEVFHLKKALNPQHKSLFILGGSKFKTKEKLIKKMLKKYDYLAIVGALANDFLKEKGFNVGHSLVSNEKIPKDLLEAENLFLPLKVVIQNQETSFEIKSIQDIEKQDMIVDCFLSEQIIDEIKSGNVKTLFWNGSFGVYEKNYIAGSRELVDNMGNIEFKIAGGGDTIANIFKLNAQDKFSFLSTAGGAMLEFLVNENLPGFVALKESQEKFL